MMLSEEREAGWPEWVALAAYLALGIVLLLHHEGWRDEADSWLMVRDAPLLHIPAILGRAGTPLLWYALLVPFARAGLPYAAQFAVHTVIAAGAAAVLLFLSPFRRPLKLLLLFSYYLGYEYLAVARSYALMILLLFALAAMYERRTERPIAFALLLALFVNTTVHALLIGAGIAAVTAWELVTCRARRRWAAIAIMLAGGLAAAAPIILYREGATVDPFGIVRWKGPLQALAGAWMPTITVRRMFLFGIASFVAAGVALLRKRDALLILCSSWAALFFIYTFVYIGDLRHFGLLLMTLLFAMWIGKPQPGHAQTVLAVLLYGTLLVSLAVAVRTWRLEVTESFSGSKEMAAYLVDNRLAGQPIAAHAPPMAESVLAYLPRGTRFWFPPLQRFGTYMEWDARQLVATDVPNDVAASQALRRDPRFLILTSGPLEHPEALGLHLVYRNPTPVFMKKDETYFLYRR